MLCLAIFIQDSVCITGWSCPILPRLVKCASYNLVIQNIKEKKKLFVNGMLFAYSYYHISMIIKIDSEKSVIQL